MPAAVETHARARASRATRLPPPTPRSPASQARSPLSPTRRLRDCGPSHSARRWCTPAAEREPAAGPPQLPPLRTTIAHLARDLAHFEAVAVGRVRAREDVRLLRRLLLRRALRQRPEPGEGEHVPAPHQHTPHQHPIGPACNHATNRSHQCSAPPDSTTAETGSEKRAARSSAHTPSAAREQRQAKGASERACLGSWCYSRRSRRWHRCE